MKYLCVILLILCLISCGHKQTNDKCSWVYAGTYLKDNGELRNPAELNLTYSTEHAVTFSERGYFIRNSAYVKLVPGKTYEVYYNETKNVVGDVR